MENNKQKEAMNLLMAFNSNYMNPAMVCILSLALNNPFDINVYVMHSSLSSKEIKRLMELSDYINAQRKDCSIEFYFINVSKELFSDNKTFSWISKETYYRLLAQKLMPEDMKRFIWLDSDIVVKADISDLYFMDFEDHLLIATGRQYEGEDYEKRLKKSFLPADHRYFNAGVLIYNLEKQRQILDADVYEKYLQVFDVHLPFADQDVLNAVFYGLTKYVDADIYNLAPAFLEKVAVSKRKEMINNGRIIHYNGGKGKPWQEKCVYLYEKYFWQYANQLKEYAGLEEKLKEKHRKYRRVYLRSKRKRESALS